MSNWIEIIQLAAPGALAKRKPKALAALTSATMLDQFVGGKDKGKGKETDFVANDDGTMDAADEF